MVRRYIYIFKGGAYVSKLGCIGIGHHQHYHKQEKQIIEHKWQFIPLLDQSHKKTCTLGVGEHKFDFELYLPGDLPQSLEAEGGQVIYRLKAIVERTAFLQNIAKKETIQIIRCMLPSEFEMIQTLEIHNTWASKMMYDILLPSKVYACNQSIPITFHITPIASNLRVRSLTGTLKEYCTYTANECTKTDTRIVRQQKIEHPFLESPVRTDFNRDESIVWTQEMRLEIPSMRTQLVFCDADNDMIRIRHKLKFIISLYNADGHLSELRCSVPIMIISSISHQTEMNTLPAYDQSFGTTLCVEITPMNIAEEESLEQPLPSPSTNPLWWNGTNLSRVPSYRTAAQQESAQLSSSLPTYDQLSVSPRHNNLLNQLSITPTRNR
jgi:hypothetical protein